MTSSNQQLETASPAVELPYARTGLAFVHRLEVL